MPGKTAVRKAREDRHDGKSPSTQAGEFVHEEMEHIRGGKHGVRSPQQAIAIGLSKARRAGVVLPPPKKGKTSPATRRKAQQDLAKARSGAHHKTSAKRSRARTQALKRESRSTASHRALSRHAKSAAARRRRNGAASA
jgi:uncharacterized protein DUF6496